MAENPDYSVGTVSITTGTKVLTGVGTMWLSADLEKGDQFAFDGYAPARIDTINNDNSITLLDTWRGPTLSGSPYFIRYQADGSGLTGQSIALRRMLSQPLLTAFAGIAAAADKLMYFTGANTMALADFKSWARTLFSLTMAADKLPYGTGVNTMGLTDLTAAGRTIIGAANAAAQKTALALVKADVGLGNVDNTSDVNKPVSTPQANVLNTKLNLSGGVMTGPISLPVGASGSYQINAASTITLANNAAILLDSFSGLIIINDQSGGAVEVYAFGGGVPALIGRTAASGLTYLWDAANVRYGIFNGTGSTKFISVTAIRTRFTA